MVGRVVAAHGIRGNLKVSSYAESLSVYETKGGLQVALPDGSFRPMTVRWVQLHGRHLLLNLDGVADRNQAECLIGAELFAEKSCLPELEDDSYYWFDLVGLRVYDATGALLGRLERIIPTPGNDVYVVKGMQGEQDKELLIPAIGNVVLKIDLEGRTMIVDPPEGL